MLTLTAAATAAALTLTPNISHPAPLNPTRPAHCAQYLGTTGAFCGKHINGHDMYVYGKQAGFSPNDMEMFLAVCHREGFEYTAARHWNKGSTDFGVCQINDKYHPEFRKWNLDNPAVNVKAAYTMWSKTVNYLTHRKHHRYSLTAAKAAAWRQWGAYKDGASNPADYSRGWARGVLAWEKNHR